MSHHGSGLPHDGLSKQFRQQFKEGFGDLMDRVEAAKRAEQTGATGNFPHGKLNPADEGELAMAVGSDPVRGVVWIDFGKQTRWIGFEAEQVDALCALLQKHKAVLIGESKK